MPFFDVFEQLFCENLPVFVFLLEICYLFLGVFIEYFEVSYICLELSELLGHFGRFFVNVHVTFQKFIFRLKGFDFFVRLFKVILELASDFWLALIVILDLDHFAVVVLELLLHIDYLGVSDIYLFLHIFEHTKGKTVLWVNHIQYFWKT